MEENKVIYIILFAKINRINDLLNQSTYNDIVADCTVCTSIKEVETIIQNQSVNSVYKYNLLTKELKQMKIINVYKIIENG